MLSRFRSKLPASTLRGGGGHVIPQPLILPRDLAQPSPVLPSVAAEVSDWPSLTMPWGLCSHISVLTLTLSAHTLLAKIL